MKRHPIIVAICEDCVDYADEGAALYRHGDTFRHLSNNSERCPGQEDDETDDRAAPMSFGRFRREFGDDRAAEIMIALMKKIAVAAGQQPYTSTNRYASK